MAATCTFKFNDLVISNAEKKESLCIALVTWDPRSTKYDICIGTIPPTKATELRLAFVENRVFWREQQPECKCSPSPQ